MIVLLYWAKLCTLIDCLWILKWKKFKNQCTQTLELGPNVNKPILYANIFVFSAFDHSVWPIFDMRSDRQNNKCLNMMHFVFLFSLRRRRAACSPSTLRLCPFSFLLYIFILECTRVCWLEVFLYYCLQTPNASGQWLAAGCCFSASPPHPLLWRRLFAMHFNSTERRNFLLFISRVMVSTVLRTSTIRCLLATTTIMT